MELKELEAVARAPFDRPSESAYDWLYQNWRERSARAEDQAASAITTMVEGQERQSGQCATHLVLFAAHVHAAKVYHAALLALHRDYPDPRVETWDVL